MFTNPFINRQAIRRRSTLRRLIARRAWLVQRLEQRCVMAADFLGGDPSELSTSDDNSFDQREGMPILVGSVRLTVPITEVVEPTPFDQLDVQQNIDFNPDVAFEDTRDLIAIVDLLNVQSTQLDVERGASLLFTWNAGELERLLSQGESLTVHVVYDATLWQAPKDQPLDDEFDFAAREAAVEAQPLILDSTLNMLSLADQSVHVQIEIQHGDTDDGVLPQIIVKLTNVAESNQTSELWTTEDFNFIGRGDLLESIVPGTRLDAQTSDLEQIEIDSSFSTNPAKQGDAGYGSSDETLTCGEPGETQPLSDVDSAPLPESRRDGADRNARTMRRTLDLRRTGGVNSHVPQIDRAAVTPSSMSTQAAIAGVYETELDISTEPSRWLLDPKPARLQVATFLLSRSPRVTDAAVASATKPVSSTSDTPANALSSAQSNEASLPTEAFDSATSGVVTSSDTNGRQQSDDKHSDELPLESEEAADNTTLYASVVDRLLSSPVSLVAVLGLTAIARFTDPDADLLTVPHR